MLILPNSYFQHINSGENWIKEKTYTALVYGLLNVPNVSFEVHQWPLWSMLIYSCICFSPGPRLRGKRGHTNPPPSPSPAQTQKHARAGALKVMRASPRISPDTGIKEWAAVPLCGFWRASRRQIIQGTRPTGEKGMGKCACAVLYRSQISCSPHLLLFTASVINMGKARWGSDKQDYMLFAPGCHNYSVVDRGGVNWDEEQTEVSVK